MRDVLTSAVSRVLVTLRKYEDDFTSAKRTPVDQPTRARTVGEYVECRFNFELFKVPELRMYEEMMDGYLFIVTNITDVLERHYDKVTLCIGPNKGYISDEEYKSLVDNVTELIGGNKLTFGSDKTDPTIIIEYNE